MTLKLNYTCFAVSDMQKSLAFYRMLGLPIPDDTDATQDHVEIEQGGLRIAWASENMLKELPGASAFQANGRVSVALEAPSPAEVDAAVQRLREAGYPIKADPYDAVWGQRYAVVLDPDGTPIDLFAPL